MNAYKVNGEPILRIITNYPQVVDKLVDGLPNASLWNQTKHPKSDYYFMWVRCPNDEVTTALGHFLRSVDLDVVMDED